MTASMKRRAFHVLGNLFLGMAIGIVGYYAVTAGVTGIAQARLRSELTSFEPVVLPGSGSVEPTEGPVLDLERWQDEDRAYWSGLSTGEVFGRISAPAMGLDAVIVMGVQYGDLKRGPGWAPYTDMPGASGNVGISGHRTTYGAPFRKLDRLDVGDTIDVFSPYRRYRYVVERQLVVTPDKVEVFSHTEEPMLTLTACHPPYSARYRLVVQARLVDVRRLDAIPAEE